VRNRGDFDGHVLLNLEEQDARILEPPRHVRNCEAALNHRVVTASLDRCSNRKRMRFAVERQDAAYDDGKCSARHAVTLDLLWRETDFRIAIDFEDAAPHAFVAHAMPAVSARRIDHDFASHFSADRIDADSAALQLECAIRDMRPTD